MADLLEPGQEFVGRYRVERALAQGGMGAVFVAEQIATELTVAIKVLFPHILASADAVEKFQFEAKVAARVKSEHIVKVLDAGYDKESGLPFLVMELLDGKELDAVVESEGPLSPLETAEYLRQVASGLDKAHGYINKEGAVEPIVHRDLKPENLFLSRRESGEAIVKILDFGIAKVLSDTAHVSQEIKGTPLFMAFEQATGKALSPQTDIWALGLIAFYLMTGEIYWKTASNPNADVSALFAEVLSLPIDSPTVRIVDLGGKAPWPEAFDAWFARCVDRDPGARFATAGQAATELALCLGVQDQVGPASSTKGLFGRSRAPADQGGLDATIAGATHLGATMPEINATPALSETTQGSGTPVGLATEERMSLSHTASSPQDAPKSRSLGPYILAAAVLLAGAGIAAALTLQGKNESTDEQALSDAPPAELPVLPAPTNRASALPQVEATPEVASPSLTQEVTVEAKAPSPARAPQPVQAQPPRVQPAPARPKQPRPARQPRPAQPQPDLYGER